MLEAKKLEIQNEITDKVLGIEGYNEEEYKEKFTINDDNLANWAIKKISLLNQEFADYKSVVDYEKSQLEFMLETKKAEIQRSENFFKGLLEEYFRKLREEGKTIDLKASIKYDLPRGKIEIKKSKEKIEIIHKEKFIDFLKANAMNDFIETKEDVPRKKLNELIFTGVEYINTETGETLGETIPGIDITETGEVFNVLPKKF